MVFIKYSRSMVCRDTFLVETPNCCFSGWSWRNETYNTMFHADRWDTWVLLNPENITDENKNGPYPNNRKWLRKMQLEGWCNVVQFPRVLNERGPANRNLIGTKQTLTIEMVSESNGGLCHHQLSWENFDQLWSYPRNCGWDLNADPYPQTTPAFEFSGERRKPGFSVSQENRNVGFLTFPHRECGRILSSHHETWPVGSLIILLWKCGERIGIAERLC